MDVGGWGEVVGVKAVVVGHGDALAEWEPELLGVLMNSRKGGDVVSGQPVYTQKF